MTDLVSRPYHPDPAKCCERCAFGTGEHEEYCPSYKACSSCCVVGHSTEECELPPAGPAKSGRGKYRGN